MINKYRITAKAPSGSELNPIPMRELDEERLTKGKRSHVYTIDERGQVCKHYRSYSDYCD